jgi:hypothetical protein
MNDLMIRGFGRLGLDLSSPELDKRPTSIVRLFQLQGTSDCTRCLPKAVVEALSARYAIVRSSNRSQNGPAPRGCSRGGRGFWAAYPS